VDLDLLDEWERERNEGKPWEGRKGLMRALGLEEGQEDELMEEPNVQVDSRDAPESDAKPEPVDKSTQTTPAPQHDASTATEPLPEPGSSRGGDNATATASTAQPAETAPAVPRRRAGRFRETVQVWDPSRLLAPTDGGAAPAHAVVLLNVPLHVDHLRTFEHLWNGGECHCSPCMHQADALAASYRVCADGGANRLFDAYFASPSSAEAASDPHAIVGDLDSLRPAVRHFFEARGVSILERPSQYATDLQKSIHAVEDIERAAPRSAPGVAAELELVIYGGLSGRLDQTMHTLHVLWLLAPGVVNPRGVEDPDEAASTEEQRGGKLKKRNRTWVVSENSLAWVLPKVSCGHRQTCSQGSCADCDLRTGQARAAPLACLARQDVWPAAHRHGCRGRVHQHKWPGVGPRCVVSSLVTHDEL
jgi:thiamine pyrophosphokinase